MILGLLSMLGVIISVVVLTVAIFIKSVKKKPWMIVLIGCTLALVIALSVATSLPEEVATQEAQPKEEAVTEKEAPKTQEEKDAEKAENRAAAEEQWKAIEEVEDKAEAQQQRDLAAEENEQTLRYYEQMIGSMDAMGTLMTEFGNLNGELGDDPSLANTEDWGMRLADNINGIQAELDYLNSVQPPPHMEEVHNTVLMAADEFQAVLDTYPGALHTMDEVLLSETVTHMANGLIYMEQANRMMEEATNI
jgi:hypothetical protein